MTTTKRSSAMMMTMNKQERGARPVWRALSPSDYRAGVRVRITQQIPRATQVQVISVEGEALRFGQQKTGSWFAHARDDKLWLDRVELRKDDGELVVCNLDQWSRVEVAA